MVTGHRFIIGILAMVILLAQASGGFAQGDEGDSIIGKDAPDFTLPVLLSDGETVTLSDYKDEKGVVVDFTATWCGPCRKNMPLLDEFYKKHKDDVEVLAIDMEDDLDMLEEYFKDKENAVSFKILHDPEAKTKKDYPFQFIPYMVLIDKKGKVIATHTSYDPDIVKFLEDKFGLEA
jgi:thiol-disulfide isomerase/thioredoxin